VGSDTGMVVMRFQSTPRIGGGDHCNRYVEAVRTGVSIHAPRTGGDPYPPACSPFAITSTRCLRDGIQSCWISHHGGKVNVHTRLDQLRAAA
jgi:hypothetical protein